MRNRAVFIRQAHKWLGLVVGLQMLIWLGSGLTMVLLDIDFIHGDSLVRNMQTPVSIPENAASGMTALYQRYPNAINIGIKSVMGRPFYAVKTADQRLLADIDSGQVVSPLDETSARDIARYHFNGEAPIARARLISSEPPLEIQSRELPLWRVDFADSYSTSFYIDPFSGSLITRRFQYWRIFDFMWMLHIMDYQERSNPHKLLLKSAQITGLLFCISGLWLLFYSFSGRRRSKSASK